MNVFLFLKLEFIKGIFTSEELQILLKNGASKENIINTNSNSDMFTNTYGYIIRKKQFCTTLRIIVYMSEASRQQQW